MMHEGTIIFVEPVDCPPIGTDVLVDYEVGGLMGSGTVHSLDGGVVHIAYNVGEDIPTPLHRIRIPYVYYEVYPYAPAQCGLTDDDLDVLAREQWYDVPDLPIEELLKVKNSQVKYMTERKNDAVKFCKQTINGETVAKIL